MRKLFIPSISLALALALCGAAFASSAGGNGLVGGETITARPKSYLDRKYEFTVRQRRDFTCGAAALATMLKIHYHMPVTEGMIFAMIAGRYTPPQLKQKAEQGLSFEDLIFVADKLGFSAQAATVPLDQLAKLNGPVIIRITIRKNDHFVVLRKMVGNLAYIADPLFGDVTLDGAEFKKAYSTAALAVWPSYIGDDYFSGLSVIRDPISVSRSLVPLQITPSTFDNARIIGYQF